MHSRQGKILQKPSRAREERVKVDRRLIILLPISNVRRFDTTFRQLASLHAHHHISIISSPPQPVYTLVRTSSTTKTIPNALSSYPQAIYDTATS